MRVTFVVVILWAIAILTTFLEIKDTGSFALLGPVYAICMIGSVVTVRNLERRQPA
jgi:hypothetical protein